MKAIIAQFTQETNSFSPVTCGMDMFESNGIVHGQDMLQAQRGDSSVTGGIIDTLERAGVEIIPALSMKSGSSGPVERAACDYFIDHLLSCIKATGPVDGVVLSLHGATQLTDEDDGIGLMLEAVRNAVGEHAIITAGTDYHANITLKCIANANAICGFQTYPHIDLRETGQRAAKLFLKAAQGEDVCLAHVKLPMIHQAEACMTDEGPMNEIIAYARAAAEVDGVYDFSIYQMQPWLDVPEGGATVMVVAKNRALAEEKALCIAQKYWDMKEQMAYKLYDLDEMLTLATENKSGKPYILSDSADSPSAGSTGDSTAILSRMLERGIDIPTMLPLVDPDAPGKAEKVGVGNTATFTLGAHWDKERYTSITVEAYVKQIHDGRWIADGVTGGGEPRNMGKTAILCIGKIVLVVFEKPGSFYDPEIFTTFGLDPGQAMLVVPKSATQYRENYKKYSTMLYNVDTPGASSANLFSFAFKKLPRPMYPFDDMHAFQVDNVNFGRK